MKMISMTRGIQCALAMLALTAVAPARAASVLGLGDLVRPPGAGANAYVLGVTNAIPSSMSLTGSSMTFNSLNGYAVFYFDSVSLVNIGDYISFEYTAKFTNFDTSNRGVRIGLLGAPTPATHLSADQNASTYNDFQNYAGYMGIYRATSAAVGGLYRRGVGGGFGDLLGGGALTNATTLNGSVDGFGISDASKFYSGSLSITKTGANEITVTSQFGGQTSFTGIDTGASIATSFDTLALFTSRTVGSAASLEFSSFSVATNVPEPGTVSLVGGALLASFFLIHRRRARSGAA